MGEILSRSFLSLGFILILFPSSSFSQESSLESDASKIIKEHLSKAESILARVGQQTKESSDLNDLDILADHLEEVEALLSEGNLKGNERKTLEIRYDILLIKGTFLDSSFWNRGTHELDYGWAADRISSNAYSAMIKFAWWWTYRLWHFNPAKIVYSRVSSIPHRIGMAKAMLYQLEARSKEHKFLVDYVQALKHYYDKKVQLLNKWLIDWQEYDKV